MLQVEGLRPGRLYAARVGVTVTLSASETDNAVFAVDVEESSPVFFRTQPTIPSVLQSPSLTQRARNALKVIDHTSRATKCNQGVYVHDLVL